MKPHLHFNPNFPHLIGAIVGTRTGGNGTVMGDGADGDGTLTGVGTGGDGTVIGDGALTGGETGATDTG